MKLSSVAGSEPITPSAPRFVRYFEVRVSVGCDVHHPSEWL